MKKLKLFLLWSIITLLSIWSFSSSWYDNVTIGVNESINSYVWKDLFCPSPTYLKVTCSKAPNCKGWSSQWNVTISDWHITLWDHLCPDWAVSNWAVYFCSALNRYNVSCSVSTDKMPVTALTPAIDWLHNTVVELIPYIVYIWIWVLLFTLWFYAIRRLVNWLSWKINSNFKSKR